MQGDRQNYMKDLMEKYMAGAGIGQNIYGTGAGMASGGANAASQFGQDQAGLEFGKYNAGPNMITGAAGAFTKFLENMMNGGKQGV